MFKYNNTCDHLYGFKYSGIINVQTVLFYPRDGTLTGTISQVRVKLGVITIGVSPPDIV